MLKRVLLVLVLTVGGIGHVQAQTVDQLLHMLDQKEKTPETIARILSDSMGDRLAFCVKQI